MSRLLIKMKGCNQAAVTLRENYSIQRLIYNLLQASKFQKIRNRKENMPFCFSNVFKTQDDVDCIIIASPHESLNYFLWDQFEKIHQIRIGEKSFVIHEVRMFNLKIQNPVTDVVTSTPVVALVRKTKCQRSALNTSNRHGYFFWTPTYPMDILKQQMYANIQKKYRAFFSEEPSMFTIHLEKLRGMIASKIETPRTQATVIGTYWQMKFQCLDEEEMRTMRFTFDVGLGERNTLGFGFINPI